MRSSAGGSPDLCPPAGADASAGPVAALAVPAVSTAQRPDGTATGVLVRGEADAMADRDAALQTLYAESAQLERLVALARDEHVASGSGSVLVAALQERVAQIDAALAQPGLTADAQAALWHERIAALQQLAGVASTERWLAAQGETFSTALVRVD